MSKKRLAERPCCQKTSSSARGVSETACSSFATASCADPDVLAEAAATVKRQTSAEAIDTRKINAYTRLHVRLAATILKAPIYNLRTRKCALSKPRRYRAAIGKKTAAWM